MKTGRVHQVVVSFTVRSLLNFAGVVSRPETAQNSASFPAGRGTLKGGYPCQLWRLDCQIYLSQTLLCGSVSTCFFFFVARPIAELPDC